MLTVCLVGCAGHGVRLMVSARICSAVSTLTIETIARDSGRYLRHSGNVQETESVCVIILESRSIIALENKMMPDVLGRR